MLLSHYLATCFIFATGISYLQASPATEDQLIECFTRVHSSGRIKPPIERYSIPWLSSWGRGVLLQCTAECLEQADCAAVLHYADSAQCTTVTGNVDVSRDRITEGLSDVFIKRQGSTTTYCPKPTTDQQEILVPPNMLASIDISQQSANTVDLGEPLEPIETINSFDDAAFRQREALRFAEWLRAKEQVQLSYRSGIQTTTPDLSSSEEVANSVKPATTRSDVMTSQSLGSQVRQPSGFPVNALTRSQLEEAIKELMTRKASTNDPCEETIAFSVGLASPVNVTNPTTSRVVLFDQVLLNLGGYFDRTSGTFLCVCPGIYSFSLDLASPKGSLASVLIMRNHQVLAKIKASGRNTADYGVASGTVATDLSEGDRVFVVLVYDEGYTYVLPDLTRLTGQRIR